MKIDNQLLDTLSAQAKANPRLRQSYDLRTTPEDQSQRILNAVEPGTILPIHRHRGSTETIVVLEIRRRREEIDALAETIEGLDLLRDCCAIVWSCSRCQVGICWPAYDSGYSYGRLVDCSHLSVPTILHR